MTLDPAQNGSWNYIMAASTIGAAPMLVLFVIFVIFQRQIMESIKTSGLKQAGAPTRNG